MASMRRDIEQLFIESRFLAQESRRLQKQSRDASLRLMRLLYESQRLCRWPPVVGPNTIPRAAIADESPTDPSDG